MGEKKETVRKEKSFGALPPEARHMKVLEAAKAESSDPSRRSVLGASAAIGVGWVAFGGATVLAFGPMFQRFMMPNALEEPDPRVRVGPLKKYAEMAVGQVNEDFKPQGIRIIRTEDSVAALTTICTHLGCITNWLRNEKKFKCPCHGSGFYQDGVNFEGPAPRPLERFKVSVEEGVVIVDKSKRFHYELGQWDSPESYITV